MCCGRTPDETFHDGMKIWAEKEIGEVAAWTRSDRRSAIRVTVRSDRDYYMGRKRNFVGQHFWARGYFVSTVGRDESVIRKYIRGHEREDRRQDQLNLI